jgi:membrane-associated protein
MIEHLLNFFEHGGLIVLFFIFFLEANPFIGYFIPGQALLIILGFLLSTSDHYSLFLVALIITLGMFFGDLLGYLLGRLFSTRGETWVKEKKWHTSMEHFFKKWGIFSIIIGKFFGPLRPLAPFLAGFYKFPFWLFAICSFICMSIWAIGSLYLGYVVGDYIAEYVDFILSVVGLLILYGVIVYGIFKGYDSISHKKSEFFDRYLVHSWLTFILSTVILVSLIYIRKFYSSDLVIFYSNFFMRELSFSITTHYITSFILFAYFFFLTYLLFKGEKKFVLYVLFSLTFLGVSSGILILIFKKFIGITLTFFIVFATALIFFIWMYFRKMRKSKLLYKYETLTLSFMILVFMSLEFLSRPDFYSLFMSFVVAVMLCELIYMFEKVLTTQYLEKEPESDKEFNLSSIVTK